MFDLYEVTLFLVAIDNINHLGNVRIYSAFDFQSPGWQVPIPPVKTLQWFSDHFRLEKVYSACTVL